MKKLKLLIPLVVLSLMLNAQTPTNDANWDSNNLILQDEFNGTAGSLPNPSIWSPNRGVYDYDATTNIAFTFWPSGNAYLDGNSNLILRAEYVPTDPKGRYLHSGAINTKSSTYSYGYYEIRCKLNSNSIHFMPAFWVWSGECSSGGWYNENDFFETICEPNHFNVTGNYHFNNTSDNCVEHNAGPQNYFVNNNTLFTDFHIYGCEWTPNKLIFYLDGQPIRSFSSSFVANHPLSICVDLGWNAIDASFYSELNALPLESREMTVDYIKVYNLKRNCIEENITNFSSDTYNNYSVKNTISISGTSYVPSYGKVTLRAQNGITIGDNFAVALGGELTLLPTTCY